MNEIVEELLHRLDEDLRGDFEERAAIIRIFEMNIIMCQYIRSIGRNRY